MVPGNIILMFEGGDVPSILRRMDGNPLYDDLMMGSKVIVCHILLRKFLYIVCSSCPGSPGTSL